MVIPPHLVTEPKVSRVKTDKRDANRLAMIRENHDFKEPCCVPDKERREDRQISRTLWGMQKDIVRTRNRIRSFSDFNGIEVSFPERWGGRGVPSFKRAAPRGFVEKRASRHLLHSFSSSGRNKEALHAALRTLCSKERYKKAFGIAMSLPGIGWFTAIRLLPLELGEDFSRFTSGKKIASFVGLTCSEYSTGETGNGRGASPAWAQGSSGRPSLKTDGWRYGRTRPSWRSLPGYGKEKAHKKKAIVAVAGCSHRAPEGVCDLRHALCDRNG